MIHKPMSGAQKRASLEKQFNAFKKCAKHIIKHAVGGEATQVFKPGNGKKPRLLPVGILTRVATINGSANLTDEAKREVEMNLIKMQKNYNNNNVEKIMKGDKWIRPSKINLKGKTKWTNSIKKFEPKIFTNIGNESIAINNIATKILVKESIRDDLKQQDEQVSCGKCGKESRISRKGFLLETLDAKIKCCGCNRSLSVTNWKCLCKKQWHTCPKHMRAGEFFGKMREMKKISKIKENEQKFNPHLIEETLKRKLQEPENKEKSTPESRRHKMLTLHPKYRDEGLCQVNNDLHQKLKLKLGFVENGTRIRNTETDSKELTEESTVEPIAADVPYQEVCNDEPLPETFTDTEFRTLSKKPIINDAPRMRPFYLVNSQVKNKASRELSLDCFDGAV